MALHPTNTRLIKFGRLAAANRKQRGQGKPETFDFLGFTHYCRRTRKGRFGVGRKLIANRMSRKLKAIKRELQRRRHADERETAQWLGQVPNRWLDYCAVPASYSRLRRFRHCLQSLWLRSLRRRSQKDCFPWERLEALCAHYWPRTYVLHPWSNQRFDVRYSRVGAVCLSGRARICE